MNKKQEEMIQSFSNNSMDFNSLYRVFKKGVDSKKKREYKDLLNKMDRNPKNRVNRSRNRKFKK